MLRLALVTVLLTLPGGVGAAAPQQDLESVLSFESTGLAGWSGGPPATLSQDSTIVVEGGFSGRIDRGESETGEGFSSFTYMIPRDFAGDRLVLRGWLRTENVTGFAGLWLRQDGRSGPVQFDNMQDRGLRGTTDWTEYTIDLPLDERTRRVFLGALMAGEGTLWVDDLRLTVDGVATAEAEPFVPPVTAVERDSAFAAGSAVDLRSPSAAQVESLVLLGRVWGFVKYHDPRVIAGQVNWDNELFRVMPAVLASPDRDSALRAISSWIAGFGELPPCGPCARPPAEPQLQADVGWIGDQDLLGTELSVQLRRIHERRPTAREHYYVSLMPNVGNPDFSNETPLGQWSLPDAGYRLLALFRYWNIIEYWFPYRDLISADWDSVLEEFVPRVTDVATPDEYRIAMMELIARIDDTHANLGSHMSVQPPVGAAGVPVVVRFIEGEAVVTGYAHPERGPASGLRIGDVIREIDGRPVASLVSEWTPFYSASNEPRRLHAIAQKLTRGVVGDVRISGSREDGDFELSTERVPLAELDPRAGATHDLPGPAFQRLSEEVAYLKLSSVATSDIPEYLAGAEGADVLVVDIRNYPSQFVVFALGGHFVEEPTEHARFTAGDLMNPGAFRMGQPLAIQPLEPFFPGAVAVLVDETSLSQAEYTAMALRIGPNAFVAGSTTAGADGNVSRIPLPGGLSTMISGIGVFYPDGTPTQRVGIVPDLEVRPTIEGVRAGRDEVLEAAVSRALGREWRLE